MYKLFDKKDIKLVFGRGSPVLITHVVMAGADRLEPWVARSESLLLSVLRALHDLKKAGVDTYQELSATLVVKALKLDAIKHFAINEHVSPGTRLMLEEYLKSLPRRAATVGDACKAADDPIFEYHGHISMRLSHLLSHFAAIEVDAAAEALARAEKKAEKEKLSSVSSVEAKKPVEQKSPLTPDVPVASESAEQSKVAETLPATVPEAAPANAANSDSRPVVRRSIPRGN